MGAENPPLQIVFGCSGVIERSGIKGGANAGENLISQHGGGRLPV